MFNVQYFNNQIEYQTLIIGLKLFKSLDVKAVQIMGDSQIVINQLLGEYKCNSPTLEGYLEEARALLEYFADVIISHVPRTCNEIANDLMQHVSGYKFIV